MPKLSAVLELGVHEADEYDKDLYQQVAWCLEELLRGVVKNDKHFKLVPQEPGKRMVDRHDKRKAEFQAKEDALNKKPELTAE